MTAIVRQLAQWYARENLAGAVNGAVKKGAGLRLGDSELVETRQERDLDETNGSAAFPPARSVVADRWHGPRPGAECGAASGSSGACPSRSDPGRHGWKWALR